MRAVASPEAVAIVVAPDRTGEDRALDASRKPAELLTLLAVHRGMRVGELVAGAGYTAELLARAVAPGGVVFAENPKVVLDGPGEELWRVRLSRQATRAIVRVDCELEDPLPPEAKELDLVLSNLVYHDTVWLGVDRDRMNHAVFSALKQGGAYAVIDHSAKPGAGFSEARTLHRADERAVREEVKRAGFRLAKASDFLRHPEDKRDWNDAPAVAGVRRGESDRFALVFVKP